MARPGNDLERLRSTKPGQSLLVEFDHAVIRAPDDQQRRRDDTIENGKRQIRPPAPGYDGPDARAELRGGDQRRCGAGACAEQPERHAMQHRVPIEPADGVGQAAGEQRNVEDVRADSLFFRSENTSADALGGTLKVPTRPSGGIATSRVSIPLGFSISLARLGDV